MTWDPQGTGSEVTHPIGEVITSRPEHIRKDPMMPYPC